MVFISMTCKAEIFKSQRLVDLGVKNETNSVCSSRIAQNYVEELKLIEATGVSDDAATEQLPVGISVVYFYRAGKIVSVCDAEFQESASRHITDIRE